MSLYLSPYTHSALRHISLCLLATDDHTLAGLDDLHLMAQRLTLPPGSFKDMKLIPHYLILTLADRHRAINYGAIPAETTEIFRRQTYWTGLEISARLRAETRTLNPTLELD